MQYLALTVLSGCALAAVWSKTNLPPPAPPPQPPRALAAKFKLDLVTDQTKEALGLYPVPGEPPGGRLFVVEKAGPIRILKGTTLLPVPFLDITGKVAMWSGPNSEQGLLGLAFHPQYLKNGRFFIHYTDIKDGTNRVMEYRVDPRNPDRAEPRPVRQLLAVEQPYSNHNAGALEFGPDGKLYVLLGDGGSADDPQGNGQNPRTILSKMVRLDVDAANRRPEILGKGMRNPWRYTFDRKTGDLYIADVGQNIWEWVHVIPAAKINIGPGGRTTSAGTSPRGSAASRRTAATSAASPRRWCSTRTARAAPSAAATCTGARRCPSWTACISTATSVPPCCAASATRMAPRWTSGTGSPCWTPIPGWPRWWPLVRTTTASCT